ncbi:uncharacterized protein B0P05DRAFT_545813 [Gilbertella persicaria]|uniref:uncharacterized protein n=1 Tax=Gilbertella persicaria TaxID=101096 RepID=UPI002221179E|nr:uncharacterized protein B0P05DRAFT_545813 [Gilbertella persicaria]KAI8076419.1 hypothetical protein B0P05DRAFT_545813 [Gilbertella persicaria]
MGANTSKNTTKNSSNRVHQQKIEDLVDLGSVLPNGLYPATEQDYDPRIVRSLIIARKIAPFYKGLPDAPEPVQPTLSQTLSPLPQSSSSLSTISIESNLSASKPSARPRSASSSSRTPGYDPFLERKKAYIEKMKQREKMLYNDAVECPICFLYYPANINYSRCCDQPICTECFIQIHRPIETPSVPATCPFCMEENYGIIYEIPLWSEKFQARSRSGSHSTVSGTRHTTSGVGESDGPRRESVSHKNPDVVLVDHIRPNWNTAAQPVRSVSRRNSASAGSRNGHSNGLLRAAGGGVSSLLTRPGRSASSAAATEYNHFLNNMRDMDLEDWMVMEAVRLSLAEQEEHQRKQQLAAKNNQHPEEQTTNASSSSH